MARTDVTEIREDLLRDLTSVQQYLAAQGVLEDGSPLQDAWAGVETFCAIAIAVMAKTNPSKIRREAVAVEIRYRFPHPPSDKKEQPDV